MKGIGLRALAASAATMFLVLACSSSTASMPQTKTVKVSKTVVTQPPPVTPVAVSVCAVPADNHAFFAYDSSSLNSLDEPDLTDMAKCLSQGPLQQATITITGHCDPRGGVPFNEQLGMQRANTVAKLLQDGGVDASRITVKSDGKAGASTKEADWPYDRRVDIQISSPSMNGINQ